MEETDYEWRTDTYVETNGIANMSISGRVQNGAKTTVKVTATWSELPAGAKITKAGTYRVLVDADAETPSKNEVINSGVFKASTLKTLKGTFYYNINMSAASAAKNLCLITYVEYTLGGNTYQVISDVATSSPNE